MEARVVIPGEAAFLEEHHRQRIADGERRGGGGGGGEPQGAGLPFHADVDGDFRLAGQRHIHRLEEVSRRARRRKGGRDLLADDTRLAETGGHHPARQLEDLAHEVYERRPELVAFPEDGLALLLEDPSRPGEDAVRVHSRPS